MKTIALSILLILFITQLQSQAAAVELNHPIAWPSLENPVTIVVEGVACNHLYVRTDNGNISPSGRDCSFVYIPVKSGESHFFIYNVSNQDTNLIEERRIMVRPWPEQPAEFAGKISGTISRGEFFAQPGVRARISGFDMAGSYEVYSYDIKVVRSGEMVLSLSNKGGHFEPGNLKRLEIIQGNDEILFEKIMAKMPGEDSPRKLNDIKISIMK